ncbi:Charged multivesicular body protein 5 [Smittium mucronatum]|uniref:Charged multivesicular body protein 5 n=1 Tax=Smittium mucronatum TaxID=133383 RepID=A0A1R0H694_9FUNG|nr:Charged multivesicular body protein 5 [Smittium mucronatum]
MADLLEDTNEIQELMGRSYNIPENVDEQDLDAELEALEAEWTYEQEHGIDSSVPSYLDNAPKLPTSAETNLTDLDKELADLVPKPPTSLPEKQPALEGEALK